MKKSCPYCAEEVMLSAKVCPHCRNWLSVCTLRNPLVFISSLLLILVIFTFGLFASLKKLVNSGENFGPYHDSISVVESHINCSPDEYGNVVYVVVVLTNKCELAWKNPQLDIRFYNKAGTFVDAGTYTSYGVIQSHDDMAIRVKSRPCQPLSEYDSCKIFVQSAVDPAVRFN